MIAKGGRVFVASSATGAAVAFPFLLPLSVVLISLTVFLAVVFRDPKRDIGNGIVAPADGVVRAVDPERGLVSTYLALRNVHVTRSPIDGVVERTVHSYGKHAPAFSTKTHTNERVEISLKTKIGPISIIEMTGAIARRIVPYINEGQPLGKGEKISLIRFGSRVDLFLPPLAVRIVVKKGQKLRAGTTCIAEVCHGGSE